MDTSTLPRWLSVELSPGPITLAQGIVWGGPGQEGKGISMVLQFGRKEENKDKPKLFLPPPQEMWKARAIPYMPQSTSLPQLDKAQGLGLLW